MGYRWKPRIRSPGLIFIRKKKTQEEKKIICILIMIDNIVYNLVKQATQQAAQPSTTQPAQPVQGQQMQQTPPPAPQSNMTVPAGQANSQVANEHRYNQTSGDMKRCMAQVDNVVFKLQKMQQQQQMPQDQSNPVKYGSFSKQAKIPRIKPRRSTSQVIRDVGLGVGGAGTGAGVLYAGAKTGDLAQEAKEDASRITNTVEDTGKKLQEGVGTVQDAVDTAKENVIKPIGDAVNTFNTKTLPEFNSSVQHANKTIQEGYNLFHDGNKILGSAKQIVRNPGQLLPQWARSAYDSVRNAMSGELIPGLPNWGLAGGALGAYALYNLFSGDDDKDDEDWEKRMRRMEEMLMMQRMSGR